MRALFSLVIGFVVFVGCNSVEPGEVVDFRVYWSEPCYQGSEYIGIFYDGGAPGARYKKGEFFSTTGRSWG